MMPYMDHGWSLTISNGGRLSHMQFISIAHICQITQMYPVCVYMYMNGWPFKWWKTKFEQFQFGQSRTIGFICNSCMNMRCIIKYSFDGNIPKWLYGIWKCIWKICCFLFSSPHLTIHFVWTIKWYIHFEQFFFHSSSIPLCLILMFVHRLCVRVWILCADCLTFYSDDGTQHVWNAFCKRLK